MADNSPSHKVVPLDKAPITAPMKRLQQKIRINSLLLRATWLGPLVLGLLWLAMWRVSALLEYAPHVSVWFPPAAVSFAALLLLGRKALLPLLCAALLATFWEDDLYQSHQPWQQLLLSGGLFGAAHLLSYGVGAAALNWVIARTQRQKLPAAILAMLVLGAISALLAALLGTQALVVGGIMDQEEAAQSWLPWWIGDLVGVVVLTPLFISVISRLYPKSGAWLSQLGLRHLREPLLPYIVKLLASMALLLLTMALTADFRYPDVAFTAFFLSIPQMWIVYTESPLRSGLSLALLSTLTALGIKWFGLGDHALIYQFAINVLAASTYFGLTVPILASHNSQLRQMVLMDSLTQVASRSHFFEQASQEIMRARHYGKPISLVVFDIDHFKEINDSFGHSVGDCALVEVAKAVQQELRQADLLGRFGGDEFLLLLPGTNLAEACHTADRLRQAIKQITAEGQSLAGSFGVVEVVEAESLMAAFDRADAQLLAAKRGGRDQVCASAG
ncbi:GGDEF domain-containing protein [Gallaecimonas kandeliae]|uniref:GGDEF domain-containing protein n=1 Tax=Gallaecimonas kandeliae TaxID=3029055 RepID=UPI00264731C8|nr:GGDEF domain-containing protein [Gallaecimonas kandeliae]WKE66641.1 GGDEF domain-containing protein [Gallaecimonas kandeliae]